MQTQTRQSPTREQIISAVEKAVLTPERKAMDDVEVRVSKRLGYDIKAQQFPLDLYFKKGNLGSNDEVARERYAAGNRFYKDFYISGLTMKLTVDLNATYGSGQSGYLPVTEIQREARDKWRAAYNAVNGAIGKMMAVNVCCHGYYLKDIETRYYRRGTDAMPRLHEVLDDLANFYFDSSEQKR